MEDLRATILIIEWKMKCLSPPELFATLKPQNPSIDVSEVHKNCSSADSVRLSIGIDRSIMYVLHSFRHLPATYK